eukprot:11194767-Lingulodinium_polyedra.AAC.1
MSWRKRTRLLFAHVDLTPMARRCAGHGTCSATGKKHRVLSGQAADGRWWTSIAEPYPRALARGLTQRFADSVVAANHRKLMAYI